MKIHIPASFCSKANKLYVINFLSSSETNQLAKFVEDLPFHVIERSDYPEDDFPKDLIKFDIKSDNDFFAAEQKILEDARIGLKPIIHIQGHGDLELGVKTEANTYISWQRWILFFESVINESKGYLTVVAACCHSFRIRELVVANKLDLVSTNGKQLLPYSFFYGFDCAIEAETMWTELRLLYGSLLRVGGKNLCIKDLNIKLHCEMDHILPVYEAIATCLDIGHRNISRKSLMKAIPPIGKASEQRKFFKGHFDSGSFVFEVIERLFWPTDLRDNLTKNIKESIDKFLNRNNPKDSVNLSDQQPVQNKDIN